VEAGTSTLREYRDVARLCRDEVRKAKAQLELNLMPRITRRASTGMSTRKGRLKKVYPP